jgi:hypothetical protein
MATFNLSPQSNADPTTPFLENGNRHQTNDTLTSLSLRLYQGLAQHESAAERLETVCAVKDLNQRPNVSVLDARISDRRVVLND